ncbi:ABC transporter ATP-binding protein [Staphylococcus xylosus]|uniref:ABC transporter ATP-binding protein n=1 Tax=Staphylococcus xylosus TaxID=1288 RepID=UPI003F56B0FC
MIKIQELTKNYRNSNVVDHVTFNIEEGECTALIGTNGAGKSTLIDMIIGVRKANSGQIIDHNKLLNSNKLSIMFQKTNFPESIKVKELYKLFSGLYKDSIDFETFTAMTRFDKQQLNQYANKLSGGQKRILDLALSLIGKPKCIFLDEPTSAMDVQMRNHFWDIITNLKNKGVTIFYTSHYIEEVERMADKVIVLEKGKVVIDDHPDKIRERKQPSKINLPIHYKVKIQGIKRYCKCHVLSQNNKVTIETTNVRGIVEYLNNINVDLNEIEITKESLLDTIFNKGDEKEEETNDF